MDDDIRNAVSVLLLPDPLVLDMSLDMAVPAWGAYHTRSPAAFHAAAPNDERDVAVTRVLNAAVAGVRARHCLARGAMTSGGDSAAVPAQRRRQAHRRHGGNHALGLSEQVRHLGRIVGAPLHEEMGNNLAGAGIDSRVELAPGPTCSTVLPGIPLALSEQLKTRTVQHQIDRPALAWARG